MKEFLERKFNLKANNTTVKTELLAGLTTFMAMAYILMVNAGMFSDLGLSYGGMYIATAISAVIGTILIGLLANLPLAQASGMGLNAFFVYTICFGLGLSYANALVLILIDGIVFVLLTVTGLRKIIFDAIPNAVKKAIPAGIGLFIAFIGLQNVGLVVADSATLVKLHSFNLLAGATWAQLMPILVTLLSLLVMGILAKKQVKGAVLFGILGGAVLYYAFAGIGAAFGDAASKGIFAEISISNPIDAFKDFGTMNFGKIFTEGFNFSDYLANHSSASLVLVIATSSLAFCLVDMFDTMGTLYGACARGNILDKDGNVPNMNRAMLADAIATCTGAVCGTSTVTTFVESSAGIAEGGKTGLTSMATGILFFLAMFLSPIAQLIPGCATAAALIYVGVLMMNCVREIDWLDPLTAVPSFLTIAMMSFTYNISYGIAFGVISYIGIALFSNIGTKKENKVKVNVATFVIGALFLAMFLLTH